MKLAPYYGQKAVDRAKSYVGKAAFSGMCQAFTVTMLGTGAVGDFDGDRDADAVDGWRKARDRGKVVLASAIRDFTKIPAGVALYWSGGSRGYGHAAVSIGGGRMVTTDASGGRVGIRDIKGWWAGSHTFLGYALVEGNGYTLHQTAKADTSKAGTAFSPSVVWVVNTTALNGRGGPGTDYRIKGKPVGRGRKIRVSRQAGQWVMSATSKRWFHVGYMTPEESAVVPKAPLKIRVGTWNITDAEKLPGTNTDARLRASAKLINDSGLAFVALQEMVRRRSEGTASQHAAKLLKLLGPDWRLLVPKGPGAVYSENYGAYRPDRVRVREHFDDTVLPANVSGKARHMGSVILTDVRSDRDVHISHFHLADGAEYDQIRVVQGARVEAVSKAQADGLPRIALGDVNRAERLPAFVAAKMLNARTAAQATTNADVATSQNIKFATPSTDPARIVDQIEVSAGATVVGYTVLGVVDDEFDPKDRNDHMLTIASTTFA